MSDSERTRAKTDTAPVPIRLLLVNFSFMFFVLNDDVSKNGSPAVHAATDFITIFIIQKNEHIQPCTGITGGIAASIHTYLIRSPCRKVQAPWTTHRARRSARR